MKNTIHLPLSFQLPHSPVETKVTKNIHCTVYLHSNNVCMRMKKLWKANEKRNELLKNNTCLFKAANVWTHLYTGYYGVNSTRFKQHGKTRCRSARLSNFVKLFPAVSWEQPKDGVLSRMFCRRKSWIIINKQHTYSYLTANLAALYLPLIFTVIIPTHITFAWMKLFYRFLFLLHYIYYFY